MSAIDQERWNALVEERCGTTFGESRMRHLAAGLWERMRRRGTRGYGEYYEYVAFNPGGKQEWTALLELLVNHETSWFRHPPTFECLGEKILRPLIMEKNKRGGAALSMWSAGCSTGDETFSMATVALATTFPELPLIRVVGSDISEKTLAHGRRGRYTSRAVANVPVAYRQRYLKLIQEQRDVYYEVNERLRSIVEFKKFNMLNPETYGLEQYDVIFCQNVLLYFRPETRMRIVTHLAERLNPEGYLFLAPGEVVGLRFPGLKMFRLGDSIVYQQIQQER